MFSRSIARLLFLSLLLALSLRGEEENLWPFSVRQSGRGTTVDSAQYLGPLFFARSAPLEQQGFRPFYQQVVMPDGAAGNFLYPFFTWRRQGEFRTFSFFQLVNLRTGPGPETAATDRQFDVWPLYFSRQGGDPAANYRAFFPLGGTIRNRFGRDRINFTLFPLYAQTDKAGKVTTNIVWPFFSSVEGAGHHGLAFWPLVGRSGRAGDYDHQFYLWPLVYQSASNLSAPTPDRKFGVLPFYARDTGPGYRSETYVWPFFGYSQRTVPYRYDEQRYFWPLVVQGRGDSRYVNRWAPIYTHSVIKGFDKTWLLWPLYRNQRWQSDGVAQQKNQVLFFLYWSLEQQSLAHPAAAPAHKTHLWPVFSAWDNGAGRRQVQLLSPFEVFFPNNDTVRQLWTPLFALYRYDRQSDTAARHSLLWDAVTYRRGPQEKEFHLGPLLSVQAGAESRRVALGGGVIGWQRRPGERHGRFFLFDFPRKPAIKAEAPPP